MYFHSHKLQVHISVSIGFCVKPFWAAFGEVVYILGYSDKHVCRLFYLLYRVISNSPMLRSCVSAELTKLFICMPHHISWEPGRPLIVLSFLLFDSGEPCVRHQRSWGIARLSQPLPCSTRRERESIATLGGSLKHGRPSQRHQTSTTSPCSTGAETGSAGWGHTSTEHLAEKIVTFQQM